MVKKPSSKGSVRSRKKFILQLTGRGLVLWLCLIFLVSGWMFVLGVLVGRGTAPVNFDIQSIQNELIALKESMLEKERSHNEANLKKEQDKNTFEFYEALKSKQKEETLEIPLDKEQPKIITKKAPPLKKKASSPANKIKDFNDVSTPKPQQEGTLGVQVASTKDQKSAEAIVRKLQEKGYPAFSMKADIPQKGTWYRVRVGYFNEKAEADAMLRQLTGNGYEGIVVRK
jgi:cell division protein FtsN